MTSNDSKGVYLKGNVVAEPLFQRWYAWPHLIAPPTAAMNVVGRHLKIMRSYLRAPEVHQAACQNPELSGGPFVNLGGEKLEEIRALIAETEMKQAPLLALAQAIRDLDRLLGAEARGRGMEPLYPRVPDVLRGYVELVYDLSSRPTFRFFEGLLYRSRYYDPSVQSFALFELHGDSRPFMLSTPVLPRDGQLELPLPFDARAMDDLFRMRSTPRPLPEIEELLAIPSAAGALFRSFFTNDVPPPRDPIDPGRTRIRYFGHACVLIETAAVSVLVDPLLGYTPISGPARYTHEDLPPVIDYVVLTHGHTDHMLLETLLSLRHRINAVLVPKSSGGTLQDPGLKPMLDRLGFRGVRELSELASVELAPGVELRALPFLGEHADLDIRSKQTILITSEGRSVLFAADTRNAEPRLYEHVRAITGDVDVLFLGMECAGAPLSWLYGPLLSEPLDRVADQSRRVNGSDHAMAMDLVERLHPQQAYVYAMGQEPWLEHVTGSAFTESSLPLVESNRFLAACSRTGITAERLYLKKELWL
jgi:L-ascorbate metabolism protein UlaG (beta-lactamase superfamily)